MSDLPEFYVRMWDDVREVPEDQETFTVAIQEAPDMTGTTVYCESFKMCDEYREASEKHSNKGDEWLDGCKEFDPAGAVLRVHDELPVMFTADGWRFSRLMDAMTCFVSTGVPLEKYRVGGES